MKYVSSIMLALLIISVHGISAQTFSDLASYCKVASEVSTPSLMARSQNIPRVKPKL